VSVQKSKRFEFPGWSFENGTGVLQHPTTGEEALAWVMPFGPYRGLTFGQIRNYAGAPGPDCTGEGCEYLCDLYTTCQAHGPGPFEDEFLKVFDMTHSDDPEDDPYAVAEREAIQWEGTS
jgi:hypothetical protein